MRRPALVLGILVIVAAALAVWWAMRAHDESPARPPTLEAEPGNEAPAPLDETAVPAIRPRPFDPSLDPAAPESAASTLDPNQIQVTGKVVDERRRPLPQARVEVVLEQRPPVLGKTGADGRFRFPVGPKSATVAPRGAVQAFDDRGRTTLVAFPLPFVDVVPGEDIDLGTLALSDGGPVTVRVLKEGAGVASARVYFGSTRWGLGSGPFLTDAQGILGPRKIPGGAYVVTVFSNDLVSRGEARAEVPRQDDAPVDVVLAPARRLRVLVKDEGTGLGVEGQQVEVTGVVRTEEAVSFRNLTIPHDPVPPTDASGRTVISGLPTGRALSVEVVSPGGRSSMFMPWQTERPHATAEPGAEEVVIILGAGGETFTFPIVADETDGPPDGAEVRLSVPEGFGGASPPPKGKVVGRSLSIERVASGCSSILATAADGTVAQLSISKEARSTGVGSDAKFKRLRALVVSVRDRKGTPLAGLAVQCRARNIPIGRPVATGADGTARLEGLFPQRVDVSVRRVGEPPWGASASASADLTKPGDGRVEIALEAERRCVLHVTVDGERRLPPTINVMMMMAGGRPGPRPVKIEEDPYAATVSFAFRPESWREAPSLTVSGKGCAAATVPVVLPADESAAFEADVALVTGAKVRVHVLPPADSVHQVAVEGWDEKRASWTPRDSGRGFGFGFGFEEPEQKPTELEVDALAAGRYRARDALTGIVTEPVDVAAGRSVDVTIDLSKAGPINGRVEGPTEGAWDQATIVVEAAGLVRGGSGPFGGRVPGASGGTRVELNTDFTVRVPGDRPVTVKVTHPILTAAPDAGSATVTAAGSKVLLKLERGAEATFRLVDDLERDDANRFGARNRVLLFAGKPEGEPIHVLTPRFDHGVGRFGGYAPGRYTIWLDLGTGAPIVLEDIELGEGVKDLGDLGFGESATLKVTVVVGEGQDFPRVTVSASSLGKPAYSRRAFGRGKSEVLVPGLGPGRFKISVTTGDVGSAPREQEVDSTGSGEIPITIDLR